LWRQRKGANDAEFGSGFFLVLETGAHGTLLSDAGIGSGDIINVVPPDELAFALG
jgi:hypothetical protein